jgi:hypothetical protein
MIYLPVSTTVIIVRAHYRMSSMDNFILFFYGKSSMDNCTYNAFTLLHLHNNGFYELFVFHTPLIY